MQAPLRPRDGKSLVVGQGLPENSSSFRRSPGLRSLSGRPKNASARGEPGPNEPALQASAARRAKARMHERAKPGWRSERPAHRLGLAPSALQFASQPSQPSTLPQLRDIPGKPCRLSQVCRLGGRYQRRCMPGFGSGSVVPTPPVFLAALVESDSSRGPTPHPNPVSRADERRDAGERLCTASAVLLL